MKKAFNSLKNNILMRRAKWKAIHSYLRNNAAKVICGLYRNLNLNRASRLLQDKQKRSLKSLVLGLIGARALKHDPKLAVYKFLN